MPLPQTLAASKLNSGLIAPVVARLAGFLVPFTVVIHTGRETGDVHRTAVFSFRNGETHAIAIMYGRGSDWEQNVLAAGGCELYRRGTTVRMSNPRVESGREATRHVPPLVRPLLRLLRVRDVMTLDRADAHGETRSNAAQ